MNVEVLQAVARATRRSSRVVHEDLRGGVYGLATIACLAPWVGIFGTIIGIVNSFQGFVGPYAAIRAAFVKRLSESLWPMAFGLLTGLLAIWSYRYLTVRLDTLDLEMENASLDLLNQLSRFPGRFGPAPAIDGVMFAGALLEQVHRKIWRRLALIGFVATIVAFCVFAWLGWGPN